MTDVGPAHRHLDWETSKTSEKDFYTKVRKIFVQKQRSMDFIYKGRLDSLQLLCACVCVYLCVRERASFGLCANIIVCSVHLDVFWRHTKTMYILHSSYMHLLCSWQEFCFETQLVAGKYSSFICLFHTFRQIVLLNFWVFFVGSGAF